MNDISKSFTSYVIAKDIIGTKIFANKLTEGLANAIYSMPALSAELNSLYLLKKNKREVYEALINDIAGDMAKAVDAEQSLTKKEI